jgi:ribosomal protein S18 acetylase RimI-like enzyme
MSEILTNASDTELGVAIEENLFAFFRANSAVPGGALYESETVNYHDACQPAALFKGVWRARLTPEQMDDAIGQAQNWFRARGSDFFAWWFNSTQPPALFERLKAHGFEFDYSSPGMALDYRMLSETLTLPDGLTIVEALDEKTLADWSFALHAANQHYHLPMEAAQSFEKVTLALGAHEAPWRLYVGYMDGKPVATNLAYNGGGVTGLFCIATIPEYRGRGIGAAITLAPLYDARAVGYQYGVLFASDSGMPVYERIGFRYVGMKIGRYVWSDK